jgi:hypothetical protein
VKNFSYYLQTWPPQAILVSDWPIFLKIITSETAWPIEPKLGRKHLRKVLYKIFVFYADRRSKMAATAGHRLT